MTKYLLGVFFSVLIIGCSSQKDIINNSDHQNEFISSEPDSVIDANTGDISDQAMNHFIDGAINEAKGDYAAAILDFQDALKLDPKAGVYFAIAKDYYLLKKYPHALSNCEKAVHLEPENLAYRDLLADIFTSANQYDSAAAILEGTIKKDSSRVQSYYKLARIYENSKPLAAIELYNKLTEKVGLDWNVLLRVGELYEKLGKLDKAASSLKKLLTIDPSNESIQILLVKIYTKGKKYQKAQKSVDEILQLNPDNVEARKLKARIYIDQDDWITAAKEFNKLIKNPDVNFNEKLSIGALYFNQSLKNSSLFQITQKFFESIDKDTTNWQIKMYLGAIAMSQEDDSAAISYFKKVTELASWNPQGWIRLGGLYFDNKKYGDAEKLMQQAIKTFPADFTINLIMGLSLSSQNKNKEAVPYLKKSVELNPDDLNALSGYAYTLSQLNKNKDAVKYLKKALLISPENVNLLGTLGLIYNTMNKNEESDSVYQKALKIDSTNALVNNNYAYALSERGINLDEAMRMIKIAVTKDSTNSSYLDTMGWVYFKKGKLEIAKKYIKKAIHYGGEDATMLEHLGDIEFKLGNKKEAKKQWEKALKLDSSKKELKTKIEKGVS